VAFHARPDRIPTGRAEILSKGSCNRRTLSTCGGFPLPVRLPRVRRSLGGTSNIQPPDQRTASFRLAREHLYQQIRLTFRVALYPSYLISASASDHHQEQNAAQSDQGRRGVFLDSVPTLEPTNLPRIVQSSSSFINRGDNHRNPVPIQNGTVLVGTFVILFR